MAPNQENIEARLCAYVDDELTAQERTEIEEHLAANPHHRRLLKELAQTRSLLRALPRAKSPADLVEEFQSQLERTALLDDEEPEPTGAVLHINRRPQIFAAAALVLLSLGLAAVIYKVLPSSASKQEVALVPSGSTPALVTTDEPGTPDGRPSASPATPGARVPAASEGVTREARKDLASAVQPQGSGFGGGSGGGGGGFMGKSGPEVAAKPFAGKPLAGSNEVLAIQGKMAKTNRTSVEAARGTLNIAGTGAMNGPAASQSDLNLAKADEGTPVMVVVNATNPTLANGDVSSYLKQNNIRFSESAELTALASPAANELKLAPAPAPATPVPTPASPVPMPAAIAIEGQRDKDAVAKKAEAVLPDSKKPGWYMGGDGQVHFGRAEEPEAAKAKQAARARAGVALNDASGTDPVNPPVVRAPTTQPLRGIEIANSYNGNSVVGNNTVNPVTYHAVMSRRQVVDLNNRLSQREGQSAEILSDVIVNRAEGYAITNNARLNGGNLAVTGTTAMAPQNKSNPETTRSSDPGAVDRVSSAGRDASKASPTADELKAGPPAVVTAEPSQANDADQNVQRSRMAQGAETPATTGGAGEKGVSSPAAESVSQDTGTQVVPNALPPVSRREEAQQFERSGGQRLSQQRAAEPASPSQSAAVQQQLAARPSAPAAAPDAATAQTLSPAAAANGSQRAMTQQQALDPDEQPHAVVIVVNGQATVQSAPAASPSTGPATLIPATRPSSATPRE